MRCHLSTSWCRNKRLGESIKECGSLSDKFVELSAPHPFENILEIEKKILDFKSQGYRFVLHNYFPPPEKSFVLNIASEEKNVIQNCENLITKALKLSKKVNSKIYAIHAGYLSKAIAQENGMFKFDEMNNNYPKSLEQSSKFINSINEKFENEKVKLCIENLFPSVSRNSSLFCSLQEIDDLMTRVPKNVGILLDLGHLNISSNLLKFDRDNFIDNFLEKYGDRLYQVHISENNGIKDEHKALQKDSWQYNVLKRIKNIKVQDKNYSRVYTLESRNATKEEIKENLDRINDILI